MNEFKDKISFNDLEFSYGESKIIDKLSFTINKGESIALVGSSGSGKTTIANLLNGFFSADSGSLLIDGINISDIKRESLYKNISIVTQESILFNDNIFNNIKIGFLLCTGNLINLTFFLLMYFNNSPPLVTINEEQSFSWS